MNAWRAFSVALMCSAALGAAGTTTASAFENNGRFMTVGPFTRQPIGHFQFCQQYPSECRAGPDAGAPPLKLTTTIMRQIAAINTEVNSTIKPASDREVYGTEEHWDFPKTRGDCEDYALLKRRRLHDVAGISYADLLMTVARKADGEGHAVLTLRTRDGDFILDSLDWSVRFWMDTPYTYLKRQDSREPARWHEIDNGSVAAVAATRN